MEGERVHSFIVALEAVVAIDFMTADAFDLERSFRSKVSTKNVNEVDCITGVIWMTQANIPALLNCIDR